MKRIQELEQAILDIILDLYNECYIKKLHVHKFGENSYNCEIYLNTDSQPINIAADLDEDSFLTYVYEELRRRHLFSDKYYTGYKIDKFDQHVDMLYYPNNFKHYSHV